MQNKLLPIGAGSLLALFLFLSTYRLGANTLWHDEAEVALLGKQILATNLPTVIYNGSFLPISHTEDYHSEFAPYLFRLQTWLMFYVAAAGMYVFGGNPFGARIMFVLFGVLTLPILYLLSVELTRNKRLSMLSVVLLMFSVQYILLIRQARYYSLVMFFSSSAVYMFIKFFAGQTLVRKVTKKKLFLVGCIFVLSMLGVFNSHYLSFFALFFSFISFHAARLILFDRTKLRRSVIMMRTTPFFLSCFVLLLLTVPWMVFFAQNFQPAKYSPSAFIANVVSIINKFNRTAPFIAILTGVYLLIKTGFKHRGLQKKTFGLVWITVFSTAFVTFLTALKIPPSIAAELRYLLIIYPILYIFLSYVVYSTFTINRVLGALLALVLVFTNALSYPWEAITKEDYWPLPQQRLELRSYFFEYIWNELRLGYVGPAGAIIDLLKQESRPGDKVFASSEGISILFHMPNIVVENDYTFWRKNNAQIHPKDLTAYEWIIFRQVCDAACIFSENNVLIAQSVLDDNFEKRILPVHDYLVDNREEIPYHLFSSPTLEPHVVVYKRKI